MGVKCARRSERVFLKEKKRSLALLLPPHVICIITLCITTETGIVEKLKYFYHVSSWEDSAEQKASVIIIIIIVKETGRGLDSGGRNRNENNA